MFSRMTITGSTGTYSGNIKKLQQALSEADFIIIGAGAGLSTSAGFVYNGERFEKYFPDFARKYRFSDMYSGGFYPYGTPEEFWAYWSRYIWINRYMNTPKPVYEQLLSLVKNKDHFVLTTNVDHCFQKAGFDKDRLFSTQGDYGLFQCSVPCHQKTYENEEVIRKMVESQGLIIGPDKDISFPEGMDPLMTIPAELLPVCPVCGEAMTMNLRSDDKFVEDAGWHNAAKRYKSFLKKLKGKVLFLELGVGFNTPGIIKYPFWNMTEENPDAWYAAINHGEAYCPEQIADRSVCINGDISAVLSDLQGKQQ